MELEAGPPGVCWARGSGERGGTQTWGPPSPRAAGMQTTPSEMPGGHLDIAARERLGRGGSTVLSARDPVITAWLGPRVI